MKKMKKRRMDTRSVHLFLSALMAGSPIATVACGGPVDREEPGEASSGVEKYDGVTVFQGVYFGTGPVASKLPEIWQNPQVQRQLSAAKAADPQTLASWLDGVAERLTTAGRTKHAERVKGVAADLRSGKLTLEEIQSARDVQQQVMIDVINEKDSTFFERFGTAMQSGDPILVEGALKEAEKTLFDAALDERLTNNDSTGWWFAVGVVVAVGYVVAAVVDVAVILHYYWVSHPTSGAADQQLQRDVLVANLSHRLAARVTEQAPALP